MDWYGEPPAALTDTAQAAAAATAVPVSATPAEAQALQAELAPLIADAMEAQAHPQQDCPHVGVLSQRRRLFFGLVCGPLLTYAATKWPSITVDPKTDVWDPLGDTDALLRAGAIACGLSVTVYHLYAWWRNRQDVSISRYGAAYTDAPGSAPVPVVGPGGLSGPLPGAPTLPGQYM